jgi:hypothetical protein
MLDDRRMHGDARTQQRHVLAALARGIIISGGTPAIHAAGLWSGAGAYSAAIRVDASASKIRGGWGSNFGWRSKFREEWKMAENELWSLLRYDILGGAASARPITGWHQSELLHCVRTQHLPLGRACGRQTKLLAHGYPSAIWGGLCSTALIGFRAAECLPEVDLPPAPN